MARVCLIRQFYVSLDARVRREVEALVRHGHQVDVTCLRGRGERATSDAGRRQSESCIRTVIFAGGRQ